ncbi:MAG TPA: class II aldolase/adducin family protein [Ignavibacteriales bacterium]|nr:class II aldolase/adducin family protein [Ignavibacteriales bacterium]
MFRKDKIVEISKKIYQNGYVAAYDGNISAKNDEKTYFITRTAKCKGELTEEDIVLIDFDGNIVSGNHKPSTEYKIHSIFYKNRDDVKAVIHCHPIHITTLSVLDIDRIEVEILPEVYLNLGEIAICEYQTPSTHELAKSIEKYIDKNVFILKNHGAVTVGKTLEEAYYRMEKFEHFAQIYLLAKQFGNIKKLTSSQLEQLKIIAQTVYKS